MDPDAILDRVEASIEALIGAGDPYDGLFPSMLDRETGAMLREIPDHVPGQREHDRAHRGNNLVHDEPVLRTMYALADVEGIDAYARAADRYLETFATECTARDHDHEGAGSATGLFPWGEHAYWHLEEWRVGNSREYARDDPGPAIHDHLRLVPAWLWEKLQEFEPRCVHDFADGLAYHWNDPEAPEYVRHAFITAKGRYPIGERACDFPRHGGHYVHDWTVAYTEAQHPEYARQIEKMLDYWWEKREPEHRGLLRFESRGRTHEISGSQTLSLGISLLDAADLLAEADLAPELRDRMRTRGEVYVEGFLALPHDYENDVFVGTCRERDLEAGEFEPLLDTEYEISSATTWVSAYGAGGPAAGAANQCLCAYRHTGTGGFLEHARTVGEHYLAHPFPTDGRLPFEETNLGMSPSTRGTMSEDDAVPIRAGNVGSVLGLFADLYDLTGNDRWLDAGRGLAGKAIDVYFDAALPRAAASVDHYESQLGPAFLLYNLARLALLDRDGEAVLGPNYTDR